MRDIPCKIVRSNSGWLAHQVLADFFWNFRCFLILFRVIQVLTINSSDHYNIFLLKIYIIGCHCLPEFFMGHLVICACLGYSSSGNSTGSMFSSVNFMMLILCCSIATLAFLESRLRMASSYATWPLENRCGLFDLRCQVLLTEETMDQLSQWK